MDDGQLQQRQAALVSADVVGYSRLIAEDEIGTIRALSACRLGYKDSSVRHQYQKAPQGHPYRQCISAPLALPLCLAISGPRTTL